MDARNFNKTARWTFYTSGAILILLGLVAFLNPMLSAVTLGVCMGIGFLIAGFNNLVPYFSMRDNPLRPKWLLPLGILDIVLGALFLTRIGLAFFALSTLLGFWILLVGVMRLWMSFQVKAAGNEKWWLMTASGALLLLCALILLSNPFAAAFAVTFLVGFVLVMAGLVIIFEGKLIYPPMPKNTKTD